MPPSTLRVSSFLARAAASLAAVVACGATAQPGAPARPALPLWETGVFAAGASQPAYPGADERTQRTLPLPYLIWRGPVLRADQGAVALRALRTPRFELNVGFGGSLGSSSDDVDARRGMSDLGTLVEAGPRLVWNLVEPGPGGQAPWRFDLPLRAVLDASDDLHHRGWALAPELVHERRLGGGWNAGLRFGPLIGDRRLADTFYGVDARHATPARQAYDARAGLVAWRLGLSLSRPLGDDLRLFAFTRLESVAGAANRASPLVRRDHGVAAGIGLAWTLARSSRAASD